MNILLYSAVPCTCSQQLEPRTQNETWTHDCLDDTLIAIFRGATTRCVLIRLPYTSLYKGNVIDNARSERDRRGRSRFV